MDDPMISAAEDFGLWDCFSCGKTQFGNITHCSLCGLSQRVSSKMYGMEWIKISEYAPDRGQRCLVWHETDEKPVFAYAAIPENGVFDYAYSGGTSRIQSDYWMPDKVIRPPDDIVRREL